ncbi:hypothetical protein Tco_0378680 [Tanacetum coccineum]
MEDQNITMEEYIRLEEEKARRRGKVYNLETAKYGKIWYDKDVHDLRFVETEFPGIVFNDSLTSEETPTCESTPTVSCIDDLDFFKAFEKEFPAIVYNGALTSKSDFSTEPTLCPQHINEFDFKDETSLFECDEEEQNTVYTAYPNPIDTEYRLSGRYPVVIFSTVYTTYSLNEYSVFDTGLRKEIDNVGGVFTISGDPEVLKS